MNDDEDWYGPEMATFGDRIAAAREAAAMTQAQFARRLGVRSATLKAWENDLSEPRANRLSMMAGLLNVSIVWLISGEGEGVVTPLDDAEITEDTRALLAEMRELRADLKRRSDQVARLEKRLRVMLTGQAHG